MRRVLRNAGEVFHYWANQIQSEGRAGNVRFNGSVVYSYAQPIGRLFTDSRIALLSNRKWSITTSGHQSAARSAIPSGWRVVYAPYVDSEPHLDNKAYWERAFISKLNMIKLHPRRTTLLREANEIRYQYERYSEAFGLDWPELNAEELGAKLAAEEREAAERAEQYAKEQEAKRLKQIAEQEENLAKWRDHKFVGSSYYFAKTALRVSKDGTRIETTRGAEVPVQSAKRLWEAACFCKQKRQEFRPAAIWKIGVYKLSSVNADGSLDIGCHHIPWDELVLTAAQLGFSAYSDEVTYQSVTEQEGAHEKQGQAA